MLLAAAAVAAVCLLAALRYLLKAPYRGVGAAYYAQPRRFLLTGAASGMGRHLASVLLRAGHSVCCTDLSGLEEVSRADGWSSLGGAVLCKKLDVTLRADWERVAAELEREWGGLDVCMNIAGYLCPAKIQDAAPRDIDVHIDVMLKGPAHGTQVAAALMAKHGIRGHVVNVSSMAAVAPVSGVTLYAAAKYGCRGLSLAANKDLAATGIAVTCLMPDAVQTPMVDLQLHADGGAYAYSGRILSVEDVGRCVVERVLPDRPAEVWLSPRQEVVGLCGLGGMLANVIHSSRLVLKQEAQMYQAGLAEQRRILAARKKEG